MEDLYDNLDNYNDTNILQELRSENQDLKHKLEEKTLAIEKLQNDYDQLNMEFKKLEINYSSLLKTARAEIERKTQIITNLNIEKDMIVLNAIHNGTHIRRNFRGSTNSYNKTNTSTGVKQDDYKIKEETLKINDATRDRNDKPSTQSKESSGLIPNTDRLISKLDPQHLVNKLSEYKENYTYHEERKATVVHKPQACSIRNRRKSMPAGSLKDRLSDEELDQKFDKEIIKKDLLLVKKSERRPLDKDDNHTSTKASESSSLNDRSSNHHEPLRETYRNRQDRNRYYDNDKTRNRNRQDTSQRNRKYSPERGYKRTTAYHDDYHHRSNNGRHRVLESPPPVTYPVRTRQNRHNFDRGPDEYHMAKSRFDEKQPYKHKIPNDDEPVSKRQKVDTIKNTNDIHNTQEWLCDSRKQLETVSAPSPFELDLYESCQSPDYAQIEAALAHPVKEIMNVAAIPLEDPRISSRKYLLKTDNNGISTLGTVTGRNVNIITIPKTQWNIEHVDIPKALMHHPSNNSNELVETIYNDIENPISNMSLESGEIYDPEDKHLDNADKNLNCAINNYMKENKQLRHDVNLIKTYSNRYRIPKIKYGIENKEPRKEMSNLDTNIDNNMEAVHESNSDNRTCNISPKRLIEKHDELTLGRGNKSKIRKECHNGKPQTSRTLVEGDLELSDENSDNVETNRINMFKINKGSCTSVTKQIDQIINKTEGDDEDRKNELDVVTTDTEIKMANQNGVKDVKPKSVPLICISATETAVPLSNHKEKEDSTLEHLTDTKNTYTAVDVSLVQENNEKEENKIGKQEDCDTNLVKIENKNVKKTHDKAKFSENKKSKGKKRIAKNKELVKVSMDSLDGQIFENKTRSSHGKETKPKEIKQKFSDLFGDSGSLITPEDLGVAIYVPMFEDAQDAVDLNINKLSQKSTPTDKIETKKRKADTKSDKTNEEPDRIDSKLIETHHKISNQISSEVLPKLVSDNINSEKSNNCLENKGHNISSEYISNVYKNLDSEPVVDKPDAVKTVIISTGTQLQISLDENKQRGPVITDSVSKTDQELAEARKIEIKKQYLKALATSTPYKEFSVQKTIETDTKSTDNKEIITSSCEPSNYCIEPPNKTDVPDVRIIVRRRRKVSKKPPVT